MSEVLTGKCTDAQIAALLIALRMKGETVEEIVGFAEAIRAAAAPLPIERANAADALAVTGTGRDALVEDVPGENSLVDTSGTGGDASGTFNISTATALVTAGSGRPRGQTRQSQHQFQMRFGRRGRSARHQHPAFTGTRRPMPARSRHLLSLCS